MKCSSTRSHPREPYYGSPAPRDPMDRVSRGHDPAELAELAVELAEGAGRLVLAGRRAGLAVGAKSTATDLVTEVDRRSERWLVDQILARPAGRRASSARRAASGAGRSGVRWVLDPIDGTVNFVLGLPYYAVSVAAESRRGGGRRGGVQPGDRRDVPGLARRRGSPRRRSG